MTASHADGYEARRIPKIHGYSSGRCVSAAETAEYHGEIHLRQWIDCRSTQKDGQPHLSPQQTALGRLLQDRRESAGYSRTRIGELVGIKPGTIEGWELGRVARPPIHDVLRLAHFLDVPTEAIQRAVFEDAGDVPSADEHPGRKERKKVRRPAGGTAALLEAGFRLLGWKDDLEAAEALGTSREQVRAWRRGEEQMTFAEHMTLTAMIGVAAAEAMKGDEARIADLSAAAEELGLNPRTPAGS